MWTDRDKGNNFTAWTEGRHTDTAENMDQRPGEDRGGGGWCAVEVEQLENAEPCKAWFSSPKR